jgi:hypothetical protein
MTRESGREKGWSLTSNAVCGCLIGMIAKSLHHIQHALSVGIPEGVYAHVLGEMMVGAFGGAILLPSLQLSEIGSRGEAGQHGPSRWGAEYEEDGKSGWENKNGSAPAY